MGEYIGGSILWVIKGDTRSLDYSSCDVRIPYMLGGPPTL